MRDYIIDTKLFLVLLISFSGFTLNAYDNQTDKDYDQLKIGNMFKMKVKDIQKGGHLKNLLEKFLLNGTVENFEHYTATNVNFEYRPPIKTSNTAQLLDTMSTIALKIGNEMVKNRNIRSIENLKNSHIPSQFCPFIQQKECEPDNNFRSIDGSCNNLKLPLLGRSNTPYKRYLKPAYDDGLEKARTKSKSGKDLPSPRVISNKLFKDNFLFDNNHTHIIAFFGQFLTHDFSMASSSVDSFGFPLTCACDTGANVNCLPMQMPSDENIMKMTCMKFTRSSTTFSTFDCKLGYREQLNLLTHYIDGSQIYGSEKFKSLNLRQMKKGLLKTSQGINSKDFLPNSIDGACHDTNSTVQCFGAGDTRVNNNLGLAGLHMLFLREHNRVANNLEKLNPQWSDERLFNEARRIVSAVYQHIVYTEYLPALIGQNFVKAFELESRGKDQYYNGYNPNVNPSVANEFSSAAFRFGHSLIRSQIGRYNLHNLVMSPSVSISDIILRPVEAYNKNAGGLDSIFISIINEPPSKFDTNIADHLQNHLFEVKVSDDTVISDDLAALNINRGRDHGISSYNTFREKCGFTRAKKFEELNDLIDPVTIRKLQSTYEDVDDIDFYVGGLSEKPINGGLLGPTFSCIIALQFRDFKKGDRFFYENGPSATAFTKDQLNEIKKSSLASVICNNFELNFIQPNVFYQPRSLANNTRIPCNQIPSIDFLKWKV